MPCKELDFDYLPTSVRELIEVIGVPAALSLVDAYGGTRLWVPERYDLSHPLVNHIGPVAMQALIGRYALDHLMIPRCAVALRASRDAALRARYHAGETARTLAREYSLTETRVYQIAATSITINPAQQTLF